MLVGEARPDDGGGAAVQQLPLGLSGAWYADMLDDNTQLKTTLSKFQSAIDLIMVKHRSQTTQVQPHPHPHARALPIHHRPMPSMPLCPPHPR